MTESKEASPNRTNGDSLEQAAPIRLWWPVAMMSVCSLLSYMDRQILTVLSPMILAELKLNVEKYGEIVSAFSVAYMLGNPMWGAILDRVGLRRGMTLAVTIWTIACGAHAVLSGFLGFAVARAILGFGEGATFPGGLRTATDWLPAKQQSRGIALAYSGGSLGAIITPLMVTPVALAYGWRTAFIVTGTAWKWILNPGLGIEHLVRLLGWDGFRFDWLVNPTYAVYTLVIAGVWQSSGFVMALFLAGLRGIDDEMVKAARLDGAGLVQIYRRIILPLLTPTFLTVGVILLHQAVKSFDLVVALTSGGPGNSTQLPATFMYLQTFGRDQMGVGAASAVMIFMTVAAIIVPYLYSDIRRAKHEG